MSSKAKLGLLVLSLFVLAGCQADSSARSYQAQIGKLIELRDAGLISDNEFQFKKNKVLKSMLL